MKLDDCGQIFEQYSNFIKIRTVGAEGQTGMTKLFAILRTCPKTTSNEMNDNDSILGKKILSLYRRCE
jgi:hypothetical protein